MYLVGDGMLLGNHPLMTQQYVQMMRTVLLKQLLEVVADGVGVAEAMTLGVNVSDGRLTLVVTCWDVLDIIGRKTPETLVELIVCVVADLTLQLQILIDLPAE